MTETSNVVAHGIDWWLREEVKNSHSGRNQILDDFAVTRASYLTGNSGYDMDIAKISSHYGRFKQVAEGVAGLSDSPSELGKYHLGKAIHHALIFVSGGFRTHAFLRADSQEAYEHNRFGKLGEFNGATNIDLLSGIGNLLIEASKLETPKDVRAYSLEHNEDIYQRRLEMYRWFVDNPGHSEDVLAADERPVEIAIETQEHGLAIALGHIVFFGNRFEGGLATVPILEPKSISDVSQHPIYPFSEWYNPS